MHQAATQPRPDTELPLVQSWLNYTLLQLNLDECDCPVIVPCTHTSTLKQEPGPLGALFSSPQSVRTFLFHCPEYAELLALRDSIPGIQLTNALPAYEDKWLTNKVCLVTLLLGRFLRSMLAWPPVLRGLPCVACLAWPPAVGGPPWVDHTVCPQMVR